MSANDQLPEDLIQEQIIHAAEQLFQTHGFNKVNMDDVAKAVGKGRSSLYYYYKSKEDIFLAVMELKIGKIIAEVGRAVDQASAVEQKIHAFYLTRLKLSTKRKELYNAMDLGMDADELSRYTKVKRLVHKRMMEQESVLLTRILKYGVEKGELDVMSQKELDVLIFILLGSLHGLKREMVIDGDFSRIEPAADTLTRVLIKGLRKPH